MEKIVLSVDEMAQVLGVCRTTAYKLVHTPGFPSARIGGSIVIPVAGLNAWLAAGGTAQRHTQEGAEA